MPGAAALNGAVVADGQSGTPSVAPGHPGILAMPAKFPRAIDGIALVAAEIRRTVECRYPQAGSRHGHRDSGSRHCR
jgi:hypothetical protein